jgi:hypothetical protein
MKTVLPLSSSDRTVDPNAPGALSSRSSWIARVSSALVTRNGALPSSGIFPAGGRARVLRYA